MEGFALGLMEQHIVSYSSHCAFGILQPREQINEIKGAEGLYFSQ